MLLRTLRQDHAGKETAHDKRHNYARIFDILKMSSIKYFSMR